MDQGGRIRRRRRGPLRLAGVLALAATVAAAAALPALAGAQRTRGKGSASVTRASGQAHGTRTAGRSSSTQVARGRATYGYHHRGHHGHHHGYHHGHSYYYYPYYYHYYWYWGWPYHYGHYGYSYPAGYSAYGDAQDLPAVVETDVRPKRATVLLDGVAVGQARDYNGTWDQLYVKPGSHVLDFQARGYMTLRVHLATNPGGRYVIDQHLQKGEGLDPRSTEAPPEPAEGAENRAEPRRPSSPARYESGSGEGGLRRGLLRIAVQPGDAAVYLDGSFLARADELSRLHGAIPVAEGTHTLEIVRPGYRSESVQVTVEGRGPVEVRLTLDRGP